MSRLTVPEAHVPAWIFLGGRREDHHAGRRFLCSSSFAVSVEGIAADLRGEPSPLRFAVAMAPALPVAELGRPFLRFDGRVLPNDPRKVEIPRDGLEGDDYAIPLGGVLYDLRLVAIVHHLFPGCVWRGPSTPDEKSFAAAFVEGQLVALVGALRTTPAELLRAQGMEVFHGS